jgi:hypothetical protein
MCLQWLKNPLINPLTNRVIVENGAIYKKLKKEAEAYIQCNNLEYNKTISEVSMDWNEENNKIFWKSPEYLNECAKDIESDTPLYNHIKSAIQSFKTPLPSIRTLEEANMTSTIPYNEISRHHVAEKMSLFNCHDGQRKLTLGFLEFISNALQYLQCSSKDVFIIYAGSSGLASAIALEMFNDLKMVLYDPDPNTITYLPVEYKKMASIHRNTYNIPENKLTSNPLMIFTDKAGWFDDKVAQYCKNILFPFSQRKHLLFVSDIRSKIGEIDIVHDMRSQMRWTMMLDASYFMLKFRLPYLDDKNTNIVRNLYKDTHHLSPYIQTPHIKNNSQKNNPTSILYIDGDMFIQPFAPQRTTELRLIGKPHPKNGYLFKYYNVNRIEDQMALFNSVYRSYTKYKDEKYGYISSFEKITEFQILINCLLCLHKEINQEEIKSIYNILNNSSKEIVHEKVSMDMCKYISFKKALRKKNVNLKKNIVPTVFQDVFYPFEKHSQ